MIGGGHTREDIKSKVIIHCCSAHMCHAFSRRLTKLTSNISLKKYVLYALCYILNEINLNTILRFFEELSTVLASPFDNENVQKSIVYVKTWFALNKQDRRSTYKSCWIDYSHQALHYVDAKRRLPATKPHIKIMHVFRFLIEIKALK